MIHLKEFVKHVESLIMNEEIPHWIDEGPNVVCIDEAIGRPSFTYR